MINSIIIIPNAIKKKTINFINEAIIESKKIIWSSKKETLKITLVIFVSSIIISLLLWTLDRIIFYIISSIINLRF
ncbi:preprotein translocase subunit SecE [Buchnera aphidicola]|uniref:preprotein translocase subunit SecE n=1 Tax=Buchnera aphidicola TaxID=9 RepID=UPI0034638562